MRRPILPPEKPAPPRRSRPWRFCPICFRPPLGAAERLEVIGRIERVHAACERHPLSPAERTTVAARRRCYPRHCAGNVRHRNPPVRASSTPRGISSSWRRSSPCTRRVAITLLLQHRFSGGSTRRPGGGRPRAAPGVAARSLRPRAREATALSPRLVGSLSLATLLIAPFQGHPHSTREILE